MESFAISELWRRCIEHDREGDWTKLLTRVEPRIRRFLIGRLLTMGYEPICDVIDEMTQDVYCRLFERGRRVFLECRASCDRQLWGYLKAICHSVAIDRHRLLTAKKRGGGSVDERLPSFEILPPRVAARSPEDAVLSDQLRARLRQMLRSLSSPEQALRNGWIFERAVVDGWTSREIAGRTGLHPSGVDSLVSRMKQRLRARGLAVPDRTAPSNSLQASDLRASA